MNPFLGLGELLADGPSALPISKRFRWRQRFQEFIKLLLSVATIERDETQRPDEGRPTRGFQERRPGEYYSVLFSRSLGMLRDRDMPG